MDFENRKITILIAEDSPTQAEQLKFLLENHQFNVIMAANGSEAFSLACEKMPDLVISDVMMPEMQGFELCRWIKSDKKTENVPVILLTSLTHVDDVFDGLDCGADSFINKPYNEKFLIPHIKNILKGQELNKHKDIALELEVSVSGKKRFISVKPVRMISLLISTYESAIRRNQDLIQAQNELLHLNNHLEDMVQKRTAELSAEIKSYRNEALQAGKLNHLYSMHAKVNQALLRISEPQHLLEIICKNALEYGKFQAAGAAILRADAKDFCCLFSAGFPNPKHAGIFVQSAILNTIEKGELTISNHLMKDHSPEDNWKKEAREMGFQSCAIFPLLHQGKCIGGFCVFSGESGFFNEPEIFRLTEIAADISFAIQRAK